MWARGITKDNLFRFRPCFGGQLHSTALNWYRTWYPMGWNRRGLNKQLRQVYLKEMLRTCQRNRMNTWINKEVAWKSGFTFNHVNTNLHYTSADTSTNIEWSWTQVITPPSLVMRTLDFLNVHFTLFQTGSPNGLCSNVLTYYHSDIS